MKSEEPGGGGEGSFRNQREVACGVHWFALVWGASPFLSSGWVDQYPFLSLASSPAGGWAEPPQADLSVAPPHSGSLNRERKVARLGNIMRRGN